MQLVSADYLAAAAATVRKPKARVKVTWTDPFRDLSISASPNDVNLTDLTFQTYDQRESMSRKWFHLDGITTLATTTYLMPYSEANATLTGLQVGWFGATRCDASGGFGAPYPALTIEFDERPVTELLVVGDDKYNEYPVDFTIKIYNGVDLLHTETVTGNDAVRYLGDISAEGIFEADKMILTITKWSTASRVVKITEFFSAFIQTYDGDDIMAIKLLEEMELSDGSLPIGNISANEIDVKFQNTDDVFNPFNIGSVLYTQMKRNRKIEPELGFELPDGSIEYAPMGVFWSGDWNTPEQEPWASTTARDRMELLRKSIFSTSEVYEDMTLYDLMEIVLEDALVQMPDLEYSIDVALDDIDVPFAWLDRQSHMSAIKKVVQAAMGRAYCDRDGKLIVLGNDDISGASDFTLTGDDYFSKTQPAKTEEIANVIEVTVSPLVEVDTTEEIYRSNGPITSSSVSITFTNPPVSEATAKAYATEVLGTTPDPISEPAEFTILTSSFTSFGASFTVDNDGEGYIIVVTGKRPEVFRSKVTSESTQSIKYTDPPIIDATAKAYQVVAGETTETELTITSSSFYAWGADFTVNNGGLDYVIVVTGKRFAVEGKEVVTAEDADSIAELGELKYTMPVNELIQTREVGQAIADALVASYAAYRRDVELSWRGNPAVELVDIATIPEYGAVTGDFYVTKQEIEFDGTLRASLSGRKVAI
jgi:hypothetical protein